MAPGPGSSVLRLHLPTISPTAGSIRLGAPQVRHLRAMRLRAGASLVLFDDQGREYAAILRRVGSRSADVEIRAATIHPSPRPVPTVVLVAGIIKGARMDALVEKATELGVSRIVPAITAFTVVRPRAVDASRVDRWRRIVVSAASQCGRSTLPQVDAPTPLTDTLPQVSGGDLGILFWERENERSLAALHRASPRPGQVTLAVGPEGGFSIAEVELARARGFHVIGLGPRILRAETAAIVALALCQATWGDLGPET